MSQSQAAIREAVIRGQKIELLHFLKNDPKIVDQQDSDLVTLLMEAAANNHINILTLLLEYKARVDTINRLGRSVLMEAACRGHPAIVLRLCQSRPDLNHVNEQHPLQMTSLMEAASRGHAGVVFWLCEAKANIDMVNRWGDTALILAAHNNRFDCVQALVAQGAKLDIKGDAGRTALETAIERGNGRVVEFLSKTELNDKEYLQQLCQKLKQQQKQVLQDEVNYDASILSRKFQEIPHYLILPSLKEQFLTVHIPTYNRGVHSAEFQFVHHQWVENKMAEKLQLDTEYARLINEWENKVAEYQRLTNSQQDNSSAENKDKNKITTPDSNSNIDSVSPVDNSGNNNDPKYPQKPAYPLSQVGPEPVFQHSELFYPTSPFKYDPNIHVPRKSPIKVLPKFGTCSWIAIPSRKMNNENIERSRDYRTKEFKQALRETQYPTLILFDDGHWAYRNDLISGDLDGTFEVFLSITHGTLGHIKNAPENPLTADFDGKFWPPVQQEGLKSAQEGDQTQINSEMDSPRQIPPFDPKYDAHQYQQSYMIRLRTGGDGDGRCLVPLQIVDCYLGKQLVLGQLLMEMSDVIAPWWNFVDPNEEAQDIAMWKQIEEQEQQK